MQFELDNLMAAPMLEKLDWVSEVWGRQLCFSQGKRYQLNAPSGNGKTSLLHILCGLRQGYSGEWRLDGHSARGLSIAQWCELRRCRLAMMFQDLRLFPELSIADNIQVKTALVDYAADPSPAAMLEALGIAELGDRRIATLSFGERQRVALVRTLSQPFEMLLLDEPFSHLDPGNIKTACELIDRACQSRQAGLLMTSLGYDYPLPVDQCLQL